MWITGRYLIADDKWKGGWRESLVLFDSKAVYDDDDDDDDYDYDDILWKYYMTDISQVLPFWVHPCPLS